MQRQHFHLSQALLQMIRIHDQHTLCLIDLINEIMPEELISTANAKDDYLYVAIKNKNEPAAIKLLTLPQQPADIVDHQYNSENGDFLLALAVENNLPELCKSLFVKSLASTNHVVIFSGALNMAADTGNLKIIQLLIPYLEKLSDKQAITNRLDQKGYSVLHYLFNWYLNLWRGSLAIPDLYFIIHRLLELGADIKVHNFEGVKPVDLFAKLPIEADLASIQPVEKKYLLRIWRLIILAEPDVTTHHLHYILLANQIGVLESECAVWFVNLVIGNHTVNAENFSKMLPEEKTEFLNFLGKLAATPYSAQEALKLIAKKYFGWHSLTALMIHYHEIGDAALVTHFSDDEKLEARLPASIMQLIPNYMARVRHELPTIIENQRAKEADRLTIICMLNDLTRIIKLYDSKDIPISTLCRIVCVLSIVITLANYIYNAVKMAPLSSTNSATTDDCISYFSAIALFLGSLCTCFWLFNKQVKLSPREHAETNASVKKFIHDILDRLPKQNELIEASNLQSLKNDVAALEKYQYLCVFQKALKNVETVLKPVLFRFSEKGHTFLFYTAQAIHKENDIAVTEVKKLAFNMAAQI